MESTDEQYQLPLMFTAVPASHSWARPSWASTTKAITPKVISLTREFIMAINAVESLDNNRCSVLLLITSREIGRVGVGVSVGVMVDHD